MTCTGCTWEPLPRYGEHLASRDPACPTHGDGSPWWAHVRATAAAARARLVCEGPA